MGFSEKAYCSGLLFCSPGDLPDPEIEPGSPALQADSFPTELQGVFFFFVCLFFFLSYNYLKRSCDLKKDVMDSVVTIINNISSILVIRLEHSF